MTEDDRLFERFCKGGDVVALGELFDRTSPALLRVAMHLARDPASAEDLVQSTFLRAIEVRDEWDRRRSVLPWLFGILHNRARHARRRDERRPDPARLTRPAPTDPASSAEHAEFDAAVDAAIAELPPAYRSVMRLHLAYGHAPGEIAHALELPPGTVRSQLARGLEKLRKLLPLGFVGAAAITLSGGRGLAAVKLVVLSRATAAVPLSLTGISTGGVALMKTKTMLAVAAVAVLGTGIWVSLPPTQEPATTSGSTGAAPMLLTEDPSSLESSPMSAPEGKSGRVAVSVSSGRSTGTLRVGCLWEDDGSRAGGVLVTVMPLGPQDGGLLQRSAKTDDDGTTLFVDLPTGLVQFATDRGGWNRAEVVAGETIDAELVIPTGVDILGRVVDEHGSPVPTARVWLSIGARNYDQGRTVLAVDPGGQFSLRSVEPGRFLSADAAGYRAAVVQPVQGQPGDEVEVELVLSGSGVALLGTVVDGEGSVVAGARVRVGVRPFGSAGWNPIMHAQYRPPKLMATDERGMFRVDGLEPGGEVVVWVRASGWCAWCRRVTLLEVGDTSLAVQLDRGGTVEGRVCDGQGDPVAQAYVTYRSFDGLAERADLRDFSGPAWAHGTVQSDSEGRYRLDHVPPGPIRLLAGASGLETRGRVIAATGQAVTWDPVLVDLVIRGRVVDDADEPLAGVSVACSPPRGEGRRASTTTDADGRFRCGELAPTPYVLSFYAPGDGLRSRAAAKLWGALPGGDEVLVRIPSTALPSASISGTLWGRDGHPHADARVRCSARGLEWDPTAQVDPLTGRFSIGPLTPGTYRVQTSVREPTQDSAWSEPVMLVAGEALDLGVLQVSEPGAIAVAVTGSDGEPLSGARVALEYATEWSATLGRTAETKDGVARIEDVAPGRYRVQVSGRGLPNTYAPVTVVAGQESKVEIRVQRSIECTLVLSPPSEAVPMQETFVWSRNGELHERWSNRWEAAAEVTLTVHLAPGAWDVTIISETGERAVNHFLVDMDDPPNREIRIHLP